MSNENGFHIWVMRLIGPLTAAAVLGGVGLAIGQSSLDERVKSNTQELDERKHLTDAVPVIQNDIEHMQQEMQKEHSVILHAIEKLENLVKQENGG